MRDSNSSSAMPSSLAHRRAGKSMSRRRFNSSFQLGHMPLFGISMFGHVLVTTSSTKAAAHVGAVSATPVVLHQVDALVEDHLRWSFWTCRTSASSCGCRSCGLDLLLGLFQRLG